MQYAVNERKARLQNRRKPLAIIEMNSLVSEGPRVYTEKE